MERQRNTQFICPESRLRCVFRRDIAPLSLPIIRYRSRFFDFGLPTNLAGLRPPIACIRAEIRLPGDPCMDSVHSQYRCFRYVWREPVVSNPSNYWSTRGQIPTRIAIGIGLLGGPGPRCDRLSRPTAAQLMAASSTPSQRWSATQNNKMIDEPLRWQLQHLSHSRTYRKRLILVDQRCAPSSERSVVDVPALLAAILLIEMHQRPSVIRAIEWIVSTLVPRCIRRPITRGPLQIADGPWNLEAAIDFAYQTLARSVVGSYSVESAIHSAAAAWNGKAVRQPCSKYGYGEVLCDAYLIASDALHH
ncbi:hypothetical protein LAUMK13_00884 [Mycobacterium innocens]|uniref:Uncharacterized protein n=1 Tax=Mycobacterium innocens TaxID=2341083 RepID=A0A498PUF1_9MYCO|nr:hypothetical protein LAUMK13_00884 [Mycobacterium innocens]